METTETDRLNLKDIAPFAVVILVTAVAIAFIVTASTAHAGETKAISDGTVDIVQEIGYTNDSAELFPAVYGADAEMASPLSGIDGVRTWKTDYVSNDVDYCTSVRNDGSLSACFRTVIALEESSGTNDALTFLNANISNFSWSKLGETVDIDGVNYAVYIAVYKGELKPNASVNVVTQIAMDKDAVNSDLTSLGEKYSIMVMTQAVRYDQTSDAATLLNSAFGEITADSHPWNRQPSTSNSSSPDETPAEGSAEQ